MGYLTNLFVSIDQLGNVLAGGNPDNTISARIGYYNYHNPDNPDQLRNPKTPWQWSVFRSIVDFTFYPIDGHGHCHEAFHSDAGERYDKETRDWAIAVLFILILFSCVVITIILYVLYALGVVSPKKIDRAEKIKLRLLGITSKQNAVVHELTETDPEIDNEIRDLADNSLDWANVIIQVIGTT